MEERFASSILATTPNKDVGKNLDILGMYWPDWGVDLRNAFARMSDPFLFPEGLSADAGNGWVQVLGCIESMPREAARNCVRRMLNLMDNVQDLLGGKEIERLSEMLCKATGKPDRDTITVISGMAESGSRSARAYLRRVMARNPITTGKKASQGIGLGL